VSLLAGPMAAEVRRRTLATCVSARWPSWHDIGEGPRTGRGGRSRRRRGRVRAKSWRPTASGPCAIWPRIMLRG
jgi:hypothetical protein